MYEWINTKQCIVYINNLTSFEDPKRILRIVWFTCKELYRLVEDVYFDESELSELKENNFKMMDKVRNIRKTIREINTTMNATRNLIQLMDDELRGILETETQQIVESNFSLIDDWWEENIEITKDESMVISTDLWTKFKRENKNILKDVEITTEKFKKYIKTKIPINNLILRSSKGNGAYDIKGIKMKEENEKVKEEESIKEKMELEMIEEPVKKRKLIRFQKREIYFDEEKDRMIIKGYSDKKDIMILSEEYNVRPWEIVSLLMKYKIITKRENAKGYDEYKETEEYKDKLSVKK